MSRRRVFENHLRPTADASVPSKYKPPKTFQEALQRRAALTSKIEDICTQISMRRPEEGCSPEEQSSFMRWRASALKSQAYARDELRKIKVDMQILNKKERDEVFALRLLQVLRDELGVERAKELADKANQLVKEARKENAAEGLHEDKS